MLIDKLNTHTYNTFFKHTNNAYENKQANQFPKAWLFLAVCFYYKTICVINI